MYGQARNDLAFCEVSSPKFAPVAYFIAIGFILAVAFHSHSKQLVAASEPVLTPVVDLK
jgi:hypothetical protein